MYISDPSQIETKSMSIIDTYLTTDHWSEDELPVVKRMIHTTGDVTYQEIIHFQGDPVSAGKKAILNGAKIVTDTMMAFSGINKPLLAKAGCTIHNFVSDPKIATIAKERGVTRSMAAMEHAVSINSEIYVVGNAPTALFRLGELIKEGKADPKLVIAVPVGFVGAAESKEFIRGIDVPSISTEGFKGGSNVAAAVFNAILYQTIERDA